MTRLTLIQIIESTEYVGVQVIEVLVYLLSMYLVFYLLDNLSCLV